MMTPMRSVFPVLALAVLAGCNEKNEAPEPIRPVLSMKVEPQAANASAVTGTVEPRYKADLSFRVLGRLIARPVYVGDIVKKDQVVAAIDPAALELAVRASVADVSRSQAQLTNATGTEGRQRTLLETDATTKATLESAEQSRAAAQASVIKAQANLAKAREQLGYAQLKADFAGIVTAVSAEVGQVVSPGVSVVTVARPDIREAVIDVGDDLASGLQAGTPFTVRLQVDPSVSASGKVREIAPRADATTRTRRVRIALDNPPEIMRLGTTVTASLDAEQKMVIRLPRSAVLEQNDKRFVWLIDTASKTVKRQEVTIATNEDGSLRVTGGLEAGQRVVTAGVNSLKDGQSIRIDQETQP
ncbi:MAG: efflux RND transporter periplasmic adaptor subunit [Bradyrhizobium sp.]|uniref:Efflux RND transporter periplasmic adaptor subunit n=7 Tax=Nitrobacteraceae TaxID=41294 RepID=A0ABS5GIC6_9BRAD|nr:MULTISPECIES: efflux RND transporter periplasmic adaptor subunit [Bradyrhizobium]RTM06890.1 MAG: efflux RND transporter periplasmic adaptor subunit [Bradyrhizobiaceae bacterium]ABQ34229.1 Putative component of multidrug efflux system (RND family) [Bradyrhizobium sp. BTAi1]MBR1141081.1 efflux RND transporter periplasmic adaptor subunit [Bradyrhizobium denitrificans]MDU1494880.1 efflux RND transporter periplasmic adaptor subunit [Bradyrhizobium sp.]MDU1547639.1 efflux RND transporter periplas